MASLGTVDKIGGGECYVEARGYNSGVDNMTEKAENQSFTRYARIYINNVENQDLCWTIHDAFWARADKCLFELWNTEPEDDDDFLDAAVMVFGAIKAEDDLLRNRIADLCKSKVRYCAADREPWESFINRLSHIPGLPADVIMRYHDDIAEDESEDDEHDALVDEQEKANGGSSGTETGSRKRKQEQSDGESSETEDDSRKRKRQVLDEIHHNEHTQEQASQL